jgi:hypothetical protein
MLCLAVMLLWAQMGGWLHGLSHTLADLHVATASHAALPHEPVAAGPGPAHTSPGAHGHTHHQGDVTQGHAEQVCEECLALAALAVVALFTFCATLPLSMGLRRPKSSGLTALQAQAFEAYRTRAPPR